MSKNTVVTAVMRTLADPTRRAVFERVVMSNEITVGELTRGSGVTQGAISQHLKSLKQAGLVAELAKVVKVVKSGELSKKVTLKGIGATAGAKAAIEAAGGSVA